MKLKDLRDKNPTDNLPKVDAGKTENIWISDYWDGAINGMMEYQGKFYWFEMIQENDDWKEGEWYRRYAIVKLSGKQLKKEFEVHEDFQRFVGTHWDSKLIKSPPKFEEGRFDDFYNKHSEYIKSRPFEDNTAIGWIEN